MIILLCGEGVTDCGDPNYWDARKKANVATDGWMQPLIRKIKDNDDIQFEVKYRNELTLFDPYRRFPAGVSGHGQKAFLAKCSAVREECDILIFMVDADDTSEARHREIVDEIIRGFNGLPNNRVGCVACVPVSASEAWLLADKTAWDNLTERNVLNLPNNPEEIWGDKRDTSSDRPHHLFKRICRQEGLEDSSSTRADLARLLNITSLQHKCPISFPHFYEMLLEPLISE